MSMNPMITPRAPVRGAAAALTTIALLLGAVPQRARAERPRCLSSGRTIAANASARLFRVGPIGEYELFVCWRPTRRVIRLGELSIDQIGPVHPLLAGKWVAYDRQYCDDDGCDGQIVVRSARTGRRLRHAPDQNGLVGGIVLTLGGDVAWIRVTAATAVYSLDARGLRTLDPGPGVVPNSLALAGSQVFWLHAAGAMTARLA
jgi:hypothetical protein